VLRLGDGSLLPAGARNTTCLAAWSGPGNSREAADGHQVKFKTQNLSVPSGATPRVLQTAGRT